jgi:hypothetical protein
VAPLAGLPPVPPPPDEPASPASASGGSGRGKKGLLIGVAAALVVAALVVALDASGGDGDDDGTEAAASASTTTTEPSTTSYTYRTTTTTPGAATTTPTVPTTTTTPTATTAPRATATPLPRSTTTTARSPQTFGDDPQLDALYASCDRGDMTACDALYRQAPRGSDYQDFGDTCGGRNDPGSFCTEIYGPTAPGASPAALVTAKDNAPGDDPHLDALYESCRAGSGGACDDLASEAAQGTVYEQYGLTCGRRYADPDGGCAARLT